MKLEYTPRAIRDLSEIWEYNARTYDAEHADAYLVFLRSRTEQLEEEYAGGRAVPGHPEYRFILVRKGRGHGHVVIYQIVDDTVEVLRYFHTAQDWEKHIDHETQ